MADRAIGHRFSNGDDDAVRELYGEFARPLFGAAYRLLGDRGLAEEAVQQAFFQAWRAADSFDANRAVAPWLFTILRRVAVDLHRREQRHRTESLTTADVIEESRVDAAWSILEVRRALQRMPDEEREVLAATHFEGLTHDEAADKLGIPVGTVKSRSFRAYRRLRHLLGDST